MSYTDRLNKMLDALKKNPWPEYAVSNNLLGFGIDLRIVDILRDIKSKLMELITYGKYVARKNGLPLRAKSQAIYHQLLLAFSKTRKWKLTP